MALSHKICNPTPFEVEIDWGKGQIVVIPADNSVTLTSEQAQQVYPDQAGYAEIKSMLDSYGVFMEDSDRDFDSQALEALRACFKQKNQRLGEMTKRQQEVNLAMGIDANPDSSIFKEKLASIGGAAIKEHMEALKKRIDIYSKVVTEAQEESKKPRVLDPARTIWVLDPPREFPSVIAKEIFLVENPQVSALHAEDLKHRFPEESDEPQNPVE